MASTTKRRFTDEFKREAVALWVTQQAPADRSGERAGHRADDAAPLATQVAGQRPADKPGGEAASIADGVTGGSGKHLLEIAIPTSWSKQHRMFDLA